ncbi:MAG: DUF6063 family protein [Desulfitobacteriaceae bacterium]|nr:DUF6063 family protein [Desulfitobacteriaceae bacterium]
MELHEEDVRSAFRIFMRLLEKGVIEENERDYQQEYLRNEVRYILEEVIERQAEVKIFAVGGVIFLTPGVANRFFGYTNAELREKMGLRNNSELYLAYFIMLNLLAKFYNSDDQSLASRQFVPLEELEETITQHVHRVMEVELDEVQVQEENFDLNLRSVAEVWLDLPPFDDQVSNLNRARNNRISLLLRVMRFLEEEGLVQVLDNQEVRLLPKMEYLVLKYYFNSQRKDYLLQLLARDLPLEAEGKE